MVAALILTRAFAVSALFFCAFSVVQSAPIGTPVDIEERNCRILSCLFERPSYFVTTSSAIKSATTENASLSLSAELEEADNFLADVVSSEPDRASADATNVSEIANVEKRMCRMLGCLFAKPSAAVSSTVSSTTDITADATDAQPSETVAGELEEATDLLAQIEIGENTSAADSIPDSTSAPAIETVELVTYD